MNSLKAYQLIGFLFGAIAMGIMIFFAKKEVLGEAWLSAGIGASSIVLIMIIYEWFK